MDQEWIEKLNQVHTIDTYPEVLEILTHDMKYINTVKVLSIIDEQADFHSAIKFIAEETDSYEYNRLAGRLFTWWIYRNTPRSLSRYLDIIERVSSGRIFYEGKYVNFMRRNLGILQPLLDRTVYMDYINIDYFSVSTLWSKYSLRISMDEKIETSQYLFIRVAVQIWSKSGAESMKLIEDYYMRMMSRRILHASPTLFNSCLHEKYRNLSSCFGINVKDDIAHIISCMSAIMIISTKTGGIGCRVTELRSCGKNIGFRGVARGIIPLAVMINSIIRYHHQGGFRNGVLNLQLDVGHPEILEFIRLRDDASAPEARALDLDNTILFTWPFLYYYKKYKEGDDTKRLFPLFDPVDAPKVHQLRGVKHFKEYMRCVEDTSIHRTYVDIDLLLSECNRINRLQGHPYYVNIDGANAKSNHNEVEPATETKPEVERFIMMTNLCLEIYEYTDYASIFSCNLFQVSLPRYVTGKDGTLSDKYNFRLLGEDIRAAIPAMTQVIKHNGDPLEQLVYHHEPKIGEEDYTGKSSLFMNVKKNNKQRNPIAGGWSGFYDACTKLKISPVGKNAINFARSVAACYLFNALAQSVNESLIYGPYETFDYSPMAKGKFQFDLWREETKTLKELGILTDEDVAKYRYPEYDEPLNPKIWRQPSITLINGCVIEPTWPSLRENIMVYKTHHSLALGLMPSATTSQFLCNTQSSEIPISNFYTRMTDYGSFSRVSDQLEEELRKLGLWNKTLVGFIFGNEGSLDILHHIVNFCHIKKIKWFPDFKMEDMPRLRKLQHHYRTILEIEPKEKLEFEAAIGRYICQGSSFNWYMRNPEDSLMNETFFSAFMMGLKTIKYYLRMVDVVVPGKNSILDSNILELITRFKSSDYVDKIKSSHRKVCEKEEENRRKGIKIMEESGAEKPLPLKLKDVIDEKIVCTMEEGCVRCS